MRLVDTFSDIAIGYLEREVKKMNLGLQGVTADEKETMALPMIELYKSENNFKKTQALMDALSKEEKRSIKKMIDFLGLAKTELGQKKLAKYLKFQSKKIETMSRKRLQLLKQSVQIYSKELSVWAQLLPNYKEYKTPGTISSRNFYINGYETSNENTYWNSTVDGLSGLPSFFNERENINANVNYRESRITSKYLGLNSRNIEKSDQRFAGCSIPKFFTCIGHITDVIAECTGEAGSFVECVEKKINEIDPGCLDCLPWFYKSNINAYTIDDGDTSMTNGIQDLAEYSKNSRNIEKSEQRFAGCSIPKFFKCIGHITDVIAECTGEAGSFVECVEKRINEIDPGCLDCLPWFYKSNINAYTIDNGDTSMTNGIQDLAEYSKNSRNFEKSEQRFAGCSIPKFFTCIGHITDVIAECTGEAGSFVECVEKRINEIDPGCIDCLPWFYKSNINAYTIDDVETSMTNGIQDIAEYSKILTDCGIAEIVECLKYVAEAIEEFVDHPDILQCIEEITAGIDKGCKDCLPWFHTSNGAFN